MYASTTVTRSLSWPKIALRWMPTFVGFPLGGLVTKLLVGRVDSIAPAIAGGAVSGAILGIAQWLGMRRTGPSPVRWVIVTAIGFAAGLGAGASSVGYHTNIGALAVQGAVCGAAIGAAQGAVLYGLLGRIVLAWPAAMAVMWAIGWTITSLAGVDVDAQYSVFGSSGALVVTAVSSVLAIALATRQERGPR